MVAARSRARYSSRAVRSSAILSAKETVDHLEKILSGRLELVAWGCTSDARQQTRKPPGHPCPSRVQLQKKMRECLLPRIEVSPTGFFTLPRRERFFWRSDKSSTSANTFLAFSTRRSYSVMLTAVARQGVRNTPTHPLTPHSRPDTRGPSYICPYIDM